MFKKKFKKSLLGYDTSTVTFLPKLHEWAARNKFLKNSFLSQYINIERNETSVRQDSSSYGHFDLQKASAQRADALKIQITCIP